VRIEDYKLIIDFMV